MAENKIARIVVGAALQVQKDTGQGLTESVYEIILADELEQRGLSNDRQVTIPIRNKGRILDEGFRADIIVENKAVIELKSAEKVKDVHKQQLLTYLKLSGKKLGLLINFGEILMKNGITRVVYGL